MRKRGRIVLAAVVLAVAGVVAWGFLHGPAEPYYKGKSLSVWLQVYWPPSGGIGEADQAVRDIGTNAIPTLLRMLRAKDTPLKTKFIKLLDRQHLVRFKITPAETKNYQASLAFAALGADAVDAVPDLTKIYDDQISGLSQALTAASLGSIGPAAKSAIPSLIRGLTSTNLALRIYTVAAIGAINSEPKLVVPALVKLLHDPNSRVQFIDESTLGNFGTNAGAAVPTLLVMLYDQDPLIRIGATNSLKKIDPDAAAKAGVK